VTILIFFMVVCCRWRCYSKFKPC